MINTIPLNKLVASRRNVRRRSDPQADFELKADIEARGLLQNLVVTRAGKPRGAFAVEAGERRRRALQSLAEEGKLAKDHEVSCLVIGDAGAAQEASLAENFQRLAMNPADECLAFRTLIDEGADIEGIARRFGLTARFVEGRLRLANLAPIVFEALGAGEIGLEAAKAYAATPDQERQAWVFEQMSRGYGAAHPDSIRRMMTQATVSATDPRARLVGEEAYVAAGGRVERDLFADEGATHWLDIALLERLATEKMEALAANAAAEHGLAFVRPVLDQWIGHSRMEGLRRVPVEREPLTDEEGARAEALEAEIEEQALLLEDAGIDAAAREAAEARIRELGDEVDTILEKPPVIDPALRGELGTFLMLDRNGRPRLDTHFYSESGSGAGADADAVGEPGDAHDEAARDAGAARSPGLSQRLADELAMQRRDILAVHVAADPAFALDLAIFLMVDGHAGYSCESSGSSLRAAPPANPIFDFRTPDAPAMLARAEAEEALDRSWGEGATRAERFDAFRALPEEARAAWLGHGVARTLEASLNHSGARACAFHEHLGQLLDIDVARWWRPTGASFFDRVPKSVALAALAEVGGEAFAERYSKSKKAELSQACERIFSGDFIAEVEAKEAALAWVPEPMRFAAASDIEDGPDAARSGADADEEGIVADPGAEAAPADAEAPAEEAPAEEAPVEAAPVEEAPAEKAA
jgi:ParB family transcriptional regulator, chromosome partitioning protein